jgi:FkbM family methyltransferase
MPRTSKIIAEHIKDNIKPNGVNISPRCTRLLSARYKNIFNIKKIPKLSLLYKFCYDNKTLAKPSTFDGFFTPIKILVRYLFDRYDQYTTLDIYSYKGKISHRINLKNTQYHSVYFNKFKEGYEPDVLSLIDLILPVNGVFYDIGSNWGMFSLYALCHVKNSRTVIAFDGQESVLEDLLTLKKAHPDFFAKLKIINSAISSAENKTTKFKSRDGFHTGLFQKTDDSDGITISTTSLDSLCLEKPNLIKIDIEGMEIDAILGAKRIIAENKPYVILENPQKDRQSLMDVFSEFEYAMFSLFIISSKNGICKMDLKDYNVSSFAKNILCIPRSRYIEFNELIGPLSSEIDFRL